MSIIREIADIFVDAAATGMRRGVADSAYDATNLARGQFHTGINNSARAATGMRFNAANAENSIDGATGLPGWLSKSLTSDWGSYLVLGERGQGKTTLCLAIGEFRAEYAGAPIFMLDAPENLKGYVESVENMEDAKKIPVNSTLIVDDAGAYIGSRRSGAKSNLEFMDIVSTLRHRQITMLINAQTSAMVDRYVLMANVVFQKWPVPFWETIERDQMKPTIEKAVNGYKNLSDEEKQKIVFCSKPGTASEGWISYDPPAYYTTEMSRFRTGAYGTTAGSRPVAPAEDYGWQGLGGY